MLNVPTSIRQTRLTGTFSIVHQMPYITRSKSRASLSTMSRSSLPLKVICTLFLLGSVAAFTPEKNFFVSPLVSQAKKIATTVAVVVSTSPLVAMAGEVDEYEYGAVNAPIGIAWGFGVVAILTALLPIALSGGEDAFNEMKDRDAGTFGTGDSSSLDKNRKRKKF